jgi:hypothetical protein
VATDGNRPLDKSTPFSVTYAKPIELTVRQATTFGDLGTMTFTAGGLARQDSPTIN